MIVTLYICVILWKCHRKHHTVIHLNFVQIHIYSLFITDFHFTGFSWLTLPLCRFLLVSLKCTYSYTSPCTIQGLFLCHLIITYSKIKKFLWKVIISKSLFQLMYKMNDEVTSLISDNTLIKLKNIFPVWWNKKPHHKLSIPLLKTFVTEKHTSYRY